MRKLLTYSRQAVKQSRSTLKINSLNTKYACSSIFLRTQVRTYAQKKTVDVPQMGDSITEGTLSAWLKNPGEFMNEDDVVCQIETDKVTADVRAPESGILNEVFAKEGETVYINKPLFSYTPGKEEAPKETKKETPAEAEPKKEVPKQEAAQPKKEEKAPQPKREEKVPQKPITPSMREISVDRTETRTPMSRMRQRVAQRLKEAQNTLAMLTTFNEVDMTNLMKMRKKYGEEFLQRHGVKLGLMSTFVKACTYALQEQPVINAVIDGNEIVYRNYVDISIAVATPKGLVVPVLRNCQNMSFADIEKQIVYYGEKARANQIALEDMQGGTFTISNGGVFRNFMGTPIINQGQSAILGMHGIKKRPVVVDDQIVARDMMYLALTYDHRLIDGREAAMFLNKVKALIEDPVAMLLE